MTKVASLAPDSCLIPTCQRVGEPDETRLHGDGHSPNPFGFPGIEKSSISLLRITPVSISITWDPKTVFMVDVMATAIPFLSTIEE